MIWEKVSLTLKRVLSFLGCSSRFETVCYKGVNLPAQHLRFGGKHYRQDEAFFNSACYEAQRLVRHCGLKLESRVLEIGCGRGRLPIGILSTVGDIARYSAVDVHKASIEWCNRYINMEHPAFTFAHIDVANPRYNKAGGQRQAELQLPFSALSFDIIYLFSVFSHLTTEDIEAYCREFQRLLHPAGKIFLTAFVEENVPDMTVNPKNYRGGGWKGPLHCVRYSREFIERIYAKYGFVIDEFSYGSEADGQSEYYLSKAKK